VKQKTAKAISRLGNLTRLEALAVRRTACILILLTAAGCKREDVREESSFGKRLLPPRFGFSRRGQSSERRWHRKAREGAEEKRRKTIIRADGSDEFGRPRSSREGNEFTRYLLINWHRGGQTLVERPKACLPAHTSAV